MHRDNRLGCISDLVFPKQHAESALCLAGSEAIVGEVVSGIEGIPYRHTALLREERQIGAESEVQSQRDVEEECDEDADDREGNVEPLDRVRSCDGRNRSSSNWMRHGQDLQRQDRASPMDVETNGTRGNRSEQHTHHAAHSCQRGVSPLLVDVPN